MPKSKAEIQADWRAKHAEKPLPERLGFPELNERFEKDLKELYQEMEKVANHALLLNNNLKAALEEMPDGDTKTHALAALTKSQNLRLKLPK